MLKSTLSRDPANTCAIGYYASRHNAPVPHDTPTDPTAGHLTYPESLRLARSGGGRVWIKVCQKQRDSTRRLRQFGGKHYPANRVSVSPSASAFM